MNSDANYHRNYGLILTGSRKRHAWWNKEEVVDEKMQVREITEKWEWEKRNTIKCICTKA